MRASNNRREQKAHLSAMQPQHKLATVEEGMPDQLSSISSLAQDKELFRNHGSRFNDDRRVAVPKAMLDILTRSKNRPGRLNRVKLTLREVSDLSVGNGYILKKGSHDTMGLNSRLQGRSGIKGGLAKRVETGKRLEKGIVSREKMKRDIKAASRQIPHPSMKHPKPMESIDTVRESQVVSVANKTIKLQALLQGRDRMTGHLYPQLQMKQHGPALVPRGAVREGQRAAFEPSLTASAPPISYLVNMSAPVNDRSRVSLFSRMNADDRVSDAAGKEWLNPRLTLTNKRQFVKPGMFIAATRDVSGEVLRVGSEGKRSEHAEWSYKLNREGAPSQSKTVGLPVVNINLNKQMIENFSIHTSSVESGLDDFREKVEKVLLEILNSVNVV